MSLGGADNVSIRGGPVLEPLKLQAPLINPPLEMGNWKQEVGVMTLLKPTE